MLQRKWWDIELIWLFSDPWTIFVGPKCKTTELKGNRLVMS